MKKRIKKQRVRVILLSITLLLGACPQGLAAEETGPEETMTFEEVPEDIVDEIPEEGPEDVIDETSDEEATDIPLEDAEVTESEAGDADIGENEEVDAEIEDADIGENEVFDAEIADTELEEPDVGDPEGEEPEVKNTEVEEPEVENTEGEGPEVKDTEGEGPEVKDTEVEEPKVKDMAVENPEAEDTEVEEPETEKSEAADGKAEIDAPKTAVKAVDPDSAAEETAVETEWIAPQLAIAYEPVEDAKEYVLPANSSSFTTADIRLLHAGNGGTNDVTTLYQTFLKKQTEKHQKPDPSLFLPSLPSNDGVYTMRITRTDPSGIAYTKEERFTVNRFGSVYRFDSALQLLLGKTVRAVAGPLTLFEYNPDPLDTSSHKVEISRDGVRQENIRYDVKPIAADRKEDSLQTWAGYAYTLAADNFREDGQYRIRLSSLDGSGNRSELNRYNGGEVAFAVDGTPPVIEESSGWEDGNWNEKTHPIRLQLLDTMGLQEVTVYGNGKQIYHRNTFPDPYRDNVEIDLRPGESQRVLLLATDRAGNLLKEEKTMTILSGAAVTQSGENTSGGSSDRILRRPNSIRDVGRTSRPWSRTILGACLGTAIGAGGFLWFRRCHRIA